MNDSDEGFTLIEVVVALALLAVVVASAATFFIRGLQSSVTLQRRQAAAAVAGQALERMRSYDASVPDLHPVTESALFKAHSLSTTADVSSKWAAVTGTKVSDSDYMYVADGVSTSSATPYAWTETAKVSGVTYDTDVYVGRCWQKTGTKTTFTCQGAQVGYVMLRVVAVTTWQDGSHRCTSGTCTFRTSTYVDPHDDPIFDSQQGSP